MRHAEGHTVRFLETPLIHNRTFSGIVIELRISGVFPYLCHLRGQQLRIAIVLVRLGVPVKLLRICFLLGHVGQDYMVCAAACRPGRPCVSVSRRNPRYSDGEDRQLGSPAARSFRIWVLWWKLPTAGKQPKRVNGMKNWRRYDAKCHYDVSTTKRWQRDTDRHRQISYR